MKQGAAGNRSEPVRHAAKPRPASAALPKQSTQPAGADHATAAARAPTPPPMGPASHAIAPGDAASKPAGQSLPPAAAPGSRLHFNHSQTPSQGQFLSRAGMLLYQGGAVEQLGRVAKGPGVPKTGAAVPRTLLWQ